jgi:hypothetical protein
MSSFNCRSADDFPKKGMFNIRTDHPVLSQCLQQFWESHGFEVKLKCKRDRSDRFS